MLFALISSLVAAGLSCNLVSDLGRDSSSMSSISCTEEKVIDIEKSVKFKKLKPPCACILLVINWSLKSASSVATAGNLDLLASLRGEFTSNMETFKNFNFLKIKGCTRGTVGCRNGLVEGHPSNRIRISHLPPLHL